MAEVMLSLEEYFILDFLMASLSIVLFVAGEMTSSFKKKTNKASGAVKLLPYAYDINVLN